MPEHPRNWLVWLATGLAVAGVIGFTLGRGSSNPVNQPVNSATAPVSNDASGSRQADKDGPPILRIGEKARLGQVEVTFTGVKFNEPYLVVSLLAKNVSDGQVFAPVSVFDGTDNFGNHMKGDDYAEIEAEGNQERKKFRPGESAVIIGCLPRAIDTARSFRVIAHVTSSNERSVLPGAMLPVELKFDWSEVQR